jgi:hypothetical protein
VRSSPSNDSPVNSIASPISLTSVMLSIGYTIYYNVFISKFVPAATHYIGGVMMKELNITKLRDEDIVVNGVADTTAHHANREGERRNSGN